MDSGTQQYPINTSGGGGGSGTVTSVSVVTANGFAGSVANASTTPAITLTTSITGLLKGNGTAISAAAAGTDYEVPLTFSTGLTRSTNTITVNTSQNISTLSNLTSNGLIKTSGGTGALSIATAGTDYQAPITLTTTGTSGAATFISNTLNIPQYTGGGGGSIQPVIRNTIMNPYLQVFDIDNSSSVYSGTWENTVVNKWISSGQLASGSLGVGTTGFVFEEISPPQFDGNVEVNALSFFVDTAETTLAVDDLVYFKHHIPYYFCNELRQNDDWVLKFNTYGSKTGIYCLTIQTDNNQATFEFEVTLVDTVETHIIQFSNMLTNSNGRAEDVILYFTLAAGSDYNTAVEGVWDNTNQYATTNQINFLDSIDNTMQFGAFQLEAGTTPTDYEVRPLVYEKVLCSNEEQRIYQAIGVGYCVDSTTFRATIVLPQPMYGNSSTNGFQNIDIIGTDVTAWTIDCPGLTGTLTVPTIFDYARNTIILEFTGLTCTAGNSGILRMAGTDTYVGVWNTP